MSETGRYNDAPITEPSDDRFGIDAFARTLATSIKNMDSPEGTVIALNGPWGSGKSSAVNLIVHHLRDAMEAEKISVINFACWWFRGEEALTLAFFRELYAGLGPTLGERFTNALPKLGARLLRAGGMVGAGIDFAGGMGAGTVAAGAMNWLSGLIQQDDTVEKLYADLVKALGEQEKRFLIIIDDIDRLAPDEALLIFRLVKSVGRLPNVVYLLVFDRHIAETIVAERYPSEGPHYLEKIIQAGFDIPEPRNDELSQQLLEQIGSLCGSPAEENIVRFMNIFYDVVRPEIKTPRDLVRLMNALAVTWPSVGGEVDHGDFIGLETLRVFRPGVHRAIRSGKERLCGTGDRGSHHSTRDLAAGYDREFLASVSEAQKEQMRRSLKRLFPRLEAVWGNMHYSSDERWRRDRRVCSEPHFDTYFRLSIGSESLPKKEIQELIARIDDREYVSATFHQALSISRSNDGTKAAMLLDELNTHAPDVADEKIGPFLAVLFALADELDVEADVLRGFRIGDNQLRIHWLLRRLTLDRFDLATRSSVFMTAAEMASLGWLVDFSDSAYRDYHPREGKEPELEANCLTTQEDADRLHGNALDRIRMASKSDELLNHRKLPYLLYRWADDAEVEVKQWTSTKLGEDQAVVKFAKAFTSYSWSQTAGDTVSRRSTRASVQYLEKIMDCPRFRARVEELAASETLDKDDAETINLFLDAWVRHDKNPRD